MLRRARVLAAKAFLAAADVLLGSSREEPEEPEENDDFAMPAGHPIVVRSARAEAMLIEGARFSRKREPEPEPEGPLAGSLQDRMDRRDF